MSKSGRNQQKLIANETAARWTKPVDKSLHSAHFSQANTNWSVSYVQMRQKKGPLNTIRGAAFCIDKPASFFQN